MTPGEFLSDVAAIYLRGPTGEAFGSGRLIAPGLVLTAGHVVDDAPGEAPRNTGWKVCLLRERTAAAPGGPRRTPPNRCGMAPAGSTSRCYG